MHFETVSNKSLFCSDLPSFLVAFCVKDMFLLCHHTWILLLIMKHQFRKFWLIGNYVNTGNVRTRFSGHGGDRWMVGLMIFGVLMIL